MESRISNWEAEFDEFKKSQEEFRISQAKFRTEFKTTTDSILLQLKLLAAKLGVESYAATPTHQPFIKSTSPLSLSLSREIESNCSQASILPQGKGSSPRESG
ncbi:hypothetical protein C1H46_027395 [Malus baccata]|uniref:Uncharacterized protein n=1 Tax=Malus baccata TaxID=106549 RepID=A0A540LL70_MALBA|nr:hypothetical protein C1H46_027395 [Malus baccata]